jgi:hypothetical protein
MFEQGGLNEEQQQPVTADKVVERDRPTVDEARSKLVKEIQGKIETGKTHWQSVFKQMKYNSRFLSGRQWPEEMDAKDRIPAHEQRYKANIILRYVNGRVAALYAKNPKAVARRRPRLDFELWDESAEQKMAAERAIEMSMMAQQPPPPEALALLDDIANGKALRARLDRVGKTLEVLFEYSLNEPIPKFKLQAKQLIRRVETCGVGYIKLGYQRVMKKQPDIEMRIKDASDRLAQIERLSADIADGEQQPDSADAEKLRIELDDLKQQESIVLREGLVFSFPRAWSIIVDPGVTQLKGFIGASWVCEEMLLEPSQVQELYGVDVRSSYTRHRDDGVRLDGRTRQEGKAAVYQFYDLEGQMMYTVCEGYPDFLEDPRQPDVKLEQFHPFYTLSFNDSEDTDSVYPQSSVELLIPMQMEINRARQGLRVHRVSNRPAHFTRKGTFGADDKDKLAMHADHELIELSIKSSETLSDAIAPKPVIPIDPALYDVEHLFSDVLRVAGDQEANLGGTTGATATESTIAENSRASSLESMKDDLEECLTDVARGAGQILLAEMSKEMVGRICGRGAAWPEFTSEEIAEEIYLEIKAGSSGRPNRAMDLHVMERVAPFVMQIPGIKPSWMATKILALMDSSIDLSEAYEDGLQSITAINGQAAVGTGDPATDPAAQGGEGAMNLQAPPDVMPQSKQMFPAPGAAQTV